MVPTGKLDLGCESSQNEQLMRKGRLIVAMLVFALLAAAASTARAAAPTVEVVPIDESFSPPLLSAACGFTVTRDVQGTLTIRTFYDASGAFVRELDQYRLVETLSANGKALVGHTNQNITTRLRADGSFTVAVAGTDFRVAVPGSGISFGSAGRLVLRFAADNTFLGVEQDVGNVQSDFGALCQALA
jgi:hypothetical protein